MDDVGHITKYDNYFSTTSYERSSTKNIFSTTNYNYTTTSDILTSTELHNKSSSNYNDKHTSNGESNMTHTNTVRTYYGFRHDKYYILTIPEMENPDEGKYFCKYFCKDCDSRRAELVFTCKYMNAINYCLSLPFSILVKCHNALTSFGITSKKPEQLNDNFGLCKNWKCWQPVLFVLNILSSSLFRSYVPYFRMQTTQSLSQFDSATVDTYLQTASIVNNVCHRYTLPNRKTVYVIQQTSKHVCVWYTIETLASSGYPKAMPRSSLIHFVCIKVAPPQLFTPQGEQSRGSNSNADRMDQTWSRLCQCVVINRHHQIAAEFLQPLLQSLSSLLADVYRRLVFPSLFLTHRPGYNR